MIRAFRSRLLGPSPLKRLFIRSSAPSIAGPSAGRCDVSLPVSSTHAEMPSNNKNHASFSQTRALSYYASRCAQRIQMSRHSVLRQQQRGVEDFVSKYTRPQEYSHGQHRVQVTAVENSWLSVNDIISRRSVLLFPTSFMLWKARLPSDITSASLTLMKVVFPTLEMLIIGCGHSIHEVDREVRLAIAEEFRVHGTVVEFMETRAAVSTFNVMNAEDRQVGAALLLPEPGPNEDDRIDLQALFADSEPLTAATPSSSALPPDRAEAPSSQGAPANSSRPAQYRKHKEIFSENN